MRKNPLRLALVVLTAGLMLAACHKSPQQQAAAASAAPQLAVQATVKQLKAGHFDQLLQLALPPTDYQRFRTDWKHQQQQSLAKITTSDRQQFTRQMGELTAPGAKAKLLAKLSPALDTWEKKGKQRLPMMVGIFRIMADAKITQSTTLTPDQKTQAQGVLDALAAWVEATDWGNKGKAEQAVGIVVDTARALKLKTLDQVYGLNYDQAMQRYATAWQGFEQLANVYGLSINDMLDSVKTKTLSQVGNTARVQVDYTVLGKPMTSTLNMVREGKRWYMSDFLKHWRDEHARPAPAASVAHAASAAAPAPAQTTKAASTSPAGSH
ncbi:MAG TPA: hypothetical protein VF269_06770 [Rhodanobacteraceae bacterium]